MGHPLITEDIKIAYYHHLHLHGGGRHEPKWRGVRVVKFPTDLILYAQAIFENKPDWIIETGTRFGGASLFFGDMLEITGAKGKVISIDVKSWDPKPHPKVEYIVGSSVDRGVVEQIVDRITGNIMVVLDSDHHKNHVVRELRLWSPHVTLGQFLVVEDCFTRSAIPYWPGEAVDWFLKRTKEFKLEPVEDQFIFAVTRGGWLRRV